MAVRKQFADDSGTDEASSSRDKDAHVMLSQVIERAIYGVKSSC